MVVNNFELPALSETIPPMKSFWLIALLFTLHVPRSAQKQEFPWESGNAFMLLCSVVDSDQNESQRALRSCGLFFETNLGRWLKAEALFL
jgi:hypothetical protein